MGTHQILQISFSTRNVESTLSGWLSLPTTIELLLIIYQNTPLTTGLSAAFVTRVLSCCWNRNDSIGSSLTWYGPVLSLSFPLDLAVVHIHWLETPSIVLFNRRTDEPCAHITCRTLVVYFPDHIAIKGVFEVSQREGLHLVHKPTDRFLCHVGQCEALSWTSFM